MSRLTRTRTNTRAFPAGTYHQTFNGTVIDRANSDGPEQMSKDVCSDSHGRPVVDSALQIDHYDMSFVIPCNGTHVSAPGNVGTATNYIPRGYQLVNPQHVSTSAPAASSSMATLLARTNPSRPGVTPLTLLQDLVEMPKMLKDVGKLLKTPRKLLNAREGANQYLAASFGWLPLVKDIHDILDLQANILRRKEELHKLYDNSSGLRRRLHIGEWTAESDQKNFSVQSDLAFVLNVDRSRLTQVQRWGVVRWKPLVSPGYHPTDLELYHLSRRITLGMTTEATMVGLWDVIPWTWMIDWFTNVRDFAMQYSNTVPSKSQDACIMTTTTTVEFNTVRTISSGIVGGGGIRAKTTKERYVGPGTLDAHLPFIGVDRLKTLAALFIQRFAR